MKENDVYQKLKMILRFLIRMICIIFIIISVFVLVSSYIKPDKAPGVIIYKPFVVQTKSMYPLVNYGDFTIVKETDINSLNIDDIIAFKTDDGLKTIARITDVKGDSLLVNSDISGSEEYMISEDDIEGIYLLKISKLGYLVLFFQSTLGFILVLLTVLILVFLYFLYIRKNILIS